METTTKGRAPEKRFGSLLNADPDVVPKGRPAKASPLDNEKAMQLHAELLGHYSSEIERQGLNRVGRALAEDYYDGEQWSATDKAELERRNQTPTVINVIAPAINWMLGGERRNRSQGKILPRSKDGRKDANNKTAYLKYLDDVSYAEMAVSDAFKDSVRTGLGWLETGVREADEGEPIYQRHVPWREMLHDSFAKRTDLSDARYLFRAKWVDLNTALMTYPDREFIVREGAAQDSASGRFIGMGMDSYGDEVMDEAEQAAFETIYYGLDNHLSVRPRVRIIEAWTRRAQMTPVMVGGNFSGEIFDPNSMGHVNDIIMAKATVKDKMKPRIEVHIMTSAGFLRSEKSPYRHNKFPFTPIWGNRRASDGQPYGLIHAMMYLQDDINKRASKATYILNTNRVSMEEGAVADIDDYVEEASRPNGVLVHKANKPRPEIDGGKELASVHLDFMSTAIDMVQQLSGITDESMGRTTNATSGKAIMARQQQGALTTAHYYDNLRHARQVHGEKVLSVIEQHVTQEREFRIVDGRGSPDFKEINQKGRPETSINGMKASFIMGEEDWKATNRQASADKLADVLKQVAPADPAILTSVLDLLVEMLDLPFGDEIVARIRNQYGIEDPDADPSDPAVIAAEEAKAAQAAEAKEAMERAKAAETAEAEKRKQEAAEAAANAVTAEFKSRREHLALQSDAIEHATDMVASRAAVPLADRLEQAARLEAERVRASQNPQPDLEPV